MDTIFMNSENSRTSEYHGVILKLTDKLDRKRGQKSIALPNFSIYYIKRLFSFEIINSKCITMLSFVYFGKVSVKKPKIRISKKRKVFSKGT